jgi:hypothetical protein
MSDREPNDAMARHGEVYAERADVETREPLTDTEIYQGELEGGEPLDAIEGRSGSLELLTDLELRGDETSDPNVAAEEGLAYVAPSDPPVVPAEAPGGIEIAAGMGASALDEPYDPDHAATLLADEDDMAARIREAIRADAATSDYADRIAIGTRGGLIVLRGTVDDIGDTDELVAVAQRVTGVVDVVEELAVDGLDQPPEGAA